MEPESAATKRKRQVKLTGIRAEEYQDAGPPKDVPSLGSAVGPSSTPQAEPQQAEELLDGGPAPSSPPS